MSVFCLVLACVVAGFAQSKDNGWVWKQRTSNLDERVTVHVALARPFRHITELLYSRADPASTEYGQWLLEHEVHEMARPPRQHIEKAVAFFEGKCASFRRRGDWLCCEVSLAFLEARLGCAFHDYTHPKQPGKILTRTRKYKLPEDLRGVVDFVSDITGFPQIRSLRSRLSNSKSRSMDDNSGTPNRVRELWKIEAKGNRTNGNKQEVGSFEVQSFDPADLHLSWSLFNVSASNISAIGNNASLSGQEGSLDIQYITGVNQGTDTVFTLVSDYFSGGLMTWLLGMAGGHAPFVHSISYSESEADQGVEYLTRMDQEFQLLGLQGHTFIAASGDDGVGCLDPVESNDPQFPASSPHVLAVGGVVDLGHSTSPRSWSFSGGGFSSLFADPEFMRAVHLHYLTHGPKLPPSSFFNASGRGYPDVASVAASEWFVYQGEETMSDGTSFAAPQVAAIISLLNDIRISQRKPPLGFVNPLLYSLSLSLFVPITTGPRNSYMSCEGFAPTKGWSPIVGFGGINFKLLADYVKNMK
jgi:tripeptidyl-peptidase-1